MPLLLLVAATFPRLRIPRLAPPLAAGDFWTVGKTATRRERRGYTKALSWEPVASTGRAGGWDNSRFWPLLLGF
jgi:hypothetical protein